MPGPRAASRQRAPMRDSATGSSMRGAVHVDVDAERAFVPIATIGGTRGWYYATWLWRVRGAMDLLAGGVGMRRGRRDPNKLAVGETLDFWRVEAFEPGRRLRLAAEMKVPGRAWLEFEVVPDGERRGDPPDRGVRTRRALRAPVLVRAACQFTS